MSRDAVDTKQPLRTGMTPVQKRVLAVVMLGSLMSAVDVTIVLLAIPDITSKLGTNLATSIWVILSYLLVASVLTTQLGRLGDIFGRGKMFNLGFLIFTAASALCGISQNIYMLIGFRILQGFGGALLQANSSAIISDTFEPHHRGKAFGFTAMGWSVGSMLGIVLGGVLTTFVGWPYIFYINIPIGIFALYFGIKYIKTKGQHKEKLDPWGMATMGAMLLLLSFGGVTIASVGVTAYSGVMVAAGLLMLPLFIMIEKKVRFPTIDMSIFKSRILSNSLTAAFFQSLGYLSITFIVIMYLQGVRGLSPLDAALLLLPGYVLLSLIAPRMGKMSDKFGARVIATIGIVLMIAALGIFFTLATHTPYYIIVLATAIVGVGSAMFYPANTSAVMANAQQSAYGSVGGLLRTLSNIGVLGSFVVTILVASLAVSRQTAFNIFLGTSNLVGNIEGSFINGMHAVFVLCTAILAIAAYLSFTRGREQRQNIRVQAA